MVHHRTAIAMVMMLVSLIPAIRTVHAAGEKPIMRTPKGEIVAFFDGPPCSEKVRAIFQGSNQENFRTTTGLATRLMTNVTQLAHRQCPQMRQISSRGVVKGKTVYQGLASSSTSWAVKERGKGGSGVAAGAAAEEGGDTGAKQKFHDDTDFLPFPAMLAKMENKTILCTNYVSKSKTCSTTIKLLKSSAEKVSTITRAPEDNDGAISTVETESENKNGFICFPPEKAVVRFKPDNWSKEDADTYLADLTNRVRDLGKELCLGFMTHGDEILLESYDEKGKRVGDTATVIALDTEPALARQE